MIQTVIFIFIILALLVVSIVLGVDYATEKKYSKYLHDDLRKSERKLRILEGLCKFLGERSIVLTKDEKDAIDCAREHSQLADDVERDFEDFGKHEREIDGCKVVVNQALIDKLKSKADTDEST